MALLPFLFSCCQLSPFHFPHCTVENWCYIVLSNVYTFIPPSHPPPPTCQKPLRSEIPCSHCPFCSIPPGSRVFAEWINYRQIGITKPIHCGLCVFPKRLYARDQTAIAFLMVGHLVEICDKDSNSNPVSTSSGLFCVYVDLSEATWNSTMYLKEHCHSL